MLFGSTPDSFCIQNQVHLSHAHQMISQILPLTHEIIVQRWHKHKMGELKQIIQGKIFAGSRIRTLDLLTQIMVTWLINRSVVPAIFWFDYVGRYMVATSPWGTIWLPYPLLRPPATTPRVCTSKRVGAQLLCLQSHATRTT